MYATVRADGMNSRLADIIGCLKQILDYCIDHPEIDAVLFGGDLFHTRGRLNVQAFNAVFETMAGFSIRKIPTLLIHGNHDQADREGSVYSIHTLRTVSTVVDQPGWQLMQGRNGGALSVMAVPYTENLAHLRDLVAQPTPHHRTPKIFLGHLGIQGAKVGADYVYPGPYDAAVGDLNPASFDSVFLGHFHLHQQLAPNAWYIGAPLHHNWGDRHDPERGFLIYDTETRLFERKSLMAPRFFEAETSLFTHLLASHQNSFPSYTEDGFVRVLDDRIWSEDEKEDFKRRLGARELEVTPLTKAKEISDRRVEITAGMGYPEILQKCIDEGVLQVDPGLDPDYLVLLGSEILAEVEDVQ